MGEIELFGKWLDDNTILNIKSISQYKAQLNLFLNRNTNFVNVGIEDKFNKIKLFILEGDRVYIRKFVMKRYAQMLRQVKLLELIKQDVDIKRVTLKDRRDESTLSYKEVANMIQSLKDEKLGITLAVLFDTGLRINPILQLKKKDLKEDGEFIYFTIVEKGGKLITKYLTKDTSKWIKQFVQSKNGNDKIIGLDYFNFWSLLKVESKKLLGEFGISPHWIRRGAAVYVYNKTKNLETVRNFLNHKNITTTIRYLSASGLHSKQLIERETRPW